MSLGNKVIRTTTVKLGIYEEDNDEHLAAALGQVKEMEDGRKFRLCKAGGALTAGILVQAPAQDAADDALVLSADAAAGQNKITVTVTAGHGGHNANALAEGFLVVNQGAGDIGTCYKIKENDAMVAGSTATITLYDNLTTALAATTNEVSVCKNPWKDVVIDANTAPLAGVPLIAVTSGYYFWALCEGIGSGTDSGSGVAAGDYLAHSGGDVVTASAAAENAIGIAINAAAANDALLVKYFAMA